MADDTGPTKYPVRGTIDRPKYMGRIVWHTLEQKHKQKFPKLDEMSPKDAPTPSDTSDPADSVSEET